MSWRSDCGAARSSERSSLRGMRMASPAKQTPLDVLMKLNGALQRDTETLLERTLESKKNYESGETTPEELAFWARSLVRALLTQVDGVIGVMRGLVLKAARLGLISEPADVIDKLKSVDDFSDDPDERKVSRIDFLENVELTLATFSRMAKGDGVVKKGDDFKYAHFKALVLSRAKITHPAAIEDWFKITTLLSSIPLGFAWFRQELTRALTGGRHSGKADSSWEKSYHRTSQQYLKGSPAPEFSRQSMDDFYAQIRAQGDRCLRYARQSYNLLREDTDRWYDIASRDLMAPETPTWTRALVRAFLTEVEGACLARCRVVKWAEEEGWYSFSAEDRLLLRKKRWRLREKLDIAFRLFPLLFEGTAKGEWSSSGWKVFEHVLKRRDEFTHPRSLKDLEAPLNLIVQVHKANIWFLEQMDI